MMQSMLCWNYLCLHVTYIYNGLIMCCLFHTTHRWTHITLGGLSITLIIVDVNSRHRCVVCYLVYRLHNSALPRPFFELLRGSLHHGP
jgi:hypothetical protein